MWITTVVPSNMNPINTAGDKANIFEGLVQKVPAKRVGGFEDIAGTVLYLCSQAGAYVDGQNFVIDGGRNLVANAQ
jgi:NAD(P)-dependent dehydrogenase (short-subunit alcohol dehydrogenase family)